MELIPLLIYLNLEVGDRKVITSLLVEAADPSSPEASLSSSLKKVSAFKAAETMKGSLMVSTDYLQVVDLKSTSRLIEMIKGTSLFTRAITIIILVRVKLSYPQSEALPVETVKIGERETLVATWPTLISPVMAIVS
jgi:predicted methyltransferase